jgi:phage baseplate assembly protein W
VRSKVPIAISFPFTLAMDGSIQLCSSYEQVVRAQVIDALMTNQGERVMRPKHGCDIQSAVFDPSDELVRHDAGSLIRSRLEDLVPRCIVRNIHVFVPDDKPNYVVIDILYRPSQYATDQSITIPLSSEFLRRYSKELAR